MRDGADGTGAGEAHADGAGALRRPTVKAGLRRLRRAPGTVQFGLDPGRAVVLSGLDEATEGWLDHLDGLRERPRLLNVAEDSGVPREVAGTVLDLLAAGGVLDDAAAGGVRWSALPEPERLRLRPDLASLALVYGRPDGGHGAMARRLSARVEVHGGGRVGTSVAALLAAAGVGRVDVTDHQKTGPADLAPAGLGTRDLGTPRGWAATRAARRRAPASGGAARGGAPDLVLLATESPISPALRDALTASGVPHLVAYVRETTGVVGPLVLPRTSSCLLCHDLARADRDPAWPQLAAQLATEPPAAAGGTQVRPCDAVLATAVASHAALQALTFLDGGEPSAVDGTLEIALPEGTVRRRPWQRHPACGCGWADAW